MNEPTLFDMPAAKPRQTRADQIFARFKAFHAANPQIWKLFEQYAMQLIQAGRENYGSMAIIERIRWHMDVETRSAEPLKIANDHKTYYSRMFAAKYPGHAGFFRLRKRTSVKKAANKNDPTFQGAQPPENEETLMDELKELAK